MRNVVSVALFPRHRIKIRRGSAIALLGWQRPGGRVYPSRFVVKQGGVSSLSHLRERAVNRRVDFWLFPATWSVGSMDFVAVALRNQV
jgi:hypothetical protein